MAFMTKTEAVNAINSTPRGVLFAVDIRNRVQHPTHRLYSDPADAPDDTTSAVRLRISKEQAISVVRNYLKKAQVKEGYRVPMSVDKTPDGQDIVVIG